MQMLPDGKCRWADVANSFAQLRFGANQFVAPPSQFLVVANINAVDVLRNVVHVRMRLLVDSTRPT